MTGSKFTGKLKAVWRWTQHAWKWLAWAVVGILGLTAAFSGSVPILSKQYWRDQFRSDLEFEVSYILDSPAAEAAQNDLVLEVRNSGRSKLFLPTRLSCHPEMPMAATSAPAFVYLTLRSSAEAATGPSLTAFTYRIENSPVYSELVPFELSNLAELPGGGASQIELRNTGILQYLCDFSIKSENGEASATPIFLKFFGGQATSNGENIEFVLSGPSDVSFFLNQ